MQFLVLFVCIAAVSANPYFRDDLLVLDYERHINPNPLIVGGSEVSISTRPFQLSLRQNGNHICGASIISPTWALSAAHCYPANPSLAAYTFRAGTASILFGGVIFNSAQIVRHPLYSRITLNNDVAVHRITGSFGGANQATIALAARLSTVAGGTSSVVSGWGLTSPGGSLSDNLRAITIPIIANQICSNTWSITENMICAGARGADSCSGDTGGPLTVGNTLVGIVSFGSAQCGHGMPGVYARIASGSIRDFISSNTGI